MIVTELDLDKAITLYLTGYISRECYDKIALEYDAELALSRATRAATADHFPHVCPKCSAPAYVGLTQVDCSRGCK